LTHFPVGKRGHAALDKRSFLTRLGRLSVDAIRRYVRSAIIEPFDRDIPRIEAGYFHFRERLDPINPLP
jgi:hypothetical protein